MGRFIVLLCIWLSILYSINCSDYIVDNSVGYGRTFTGIGAISGGGEGALLPGEKKIFWCGSDMATSKLLVNYPEQERSDILDFLFKPNFGASLHMFKVEIGGDMQSTEGTEASHMHNSWDENYHRGYEWWMMKEAKKRNPDIKLYALPWGFPGFLRDSQGTPWKNIQTTADYIVKWINGAKVYHNLTLDFIGIWNESPYNISYIKTLRNSLNDAGFSKTQIIATDQEGWPIAEDVMHDQQLYDDVFAIGSHYPGTKSDIAAKKTKKPLWASEDWSCIDPLTGPGCLARTLNQNYVNGHITTTVIWNIISSYYYGLPWYGSGIMTASEPWSGHYVVAASVWITAHTTQFTQIGWKYLQHGYGVGNLTGGGSYVVLMSPDEKDFTIIIETLSHDNSICVRPPLAPFNVATAQTANFLFKGKLGQMVNSLNVWYSRVGYGKYQPLYFQKQESIQVIGGAVKLDVQVNELYTLTTLNTGLKGSVSFIPEPKPFPLPYTENFESYQEHEEAFNFAQQIGSFEVVELNNTKVLKQVVLEKPVHWFWCKVDGHNTSLNVIGDYNWKKINAEVKVSVQGENSTDSVFLATRATNGGCRALLGSGLFLFFYPKESKFIFCTDLLQTKVLASGKVDDINPVWNLLSMIVDGDRVEGYVNNQVVVNMTVPITITNGWVAVGSYPFGTAYFDDLFLAPS